jgi:RNA polymerase sigma-70 factor, ECF subfamily
MTVEGTDKDLVQRAQRGDVTAIGELYDGYHSHIFRYVWSRVRDRQTAEDLTGEIFARLITHLPGYRPQDVPFRAWLYRIAHNLVVDHFRLENGRSHTPLHLAEPVYETRPGPAAVVEQRLTLERVQQALEVIDPAQREVILLRFVMGLPLSEVALTLDKSLAAVKSLQHRGITALQAALLMI